MILCQILVFTVSTLLSIAIVTQNQFLLVEYNSARSFHSLRGPGGSAHSTRVMWNYIAFPRTFLCSPLALPTPQTAVNH